VLGGRPDGIGIGRVGQHHPPHAVGQRRGEEATQSQEDHAPDAVPDKDDRAGTEECEDGVQRPRHHIETIVGRRRTRRVAQAWQIPQNEAIALPHLLQEVVPLRTGDTPAMGDQQRRRVWGTIEFEMQCGTVWAGQVLHAPGPGRERHRRPGSPPEGIDQEPAAARHEHQQEPAAQGGRLPGDIGVPVGHPLAEG
jgi:hypothetical protein